MTETSSDEDIRQVFMSSYKAWELVAMDPFTTFEQREHIWEEYVRSREMWLMVTGYFASRKNKHTN